MNSNDPRDQAPPRADGAGPSAERRYARRIDCSPRERAAQPAPHPGGAAPAPPRDGAHP